MVHIPRILKDFRETGALHSLIALWGFVDDSTFLTKAGAVGVVYSVQGVDVECLDHPQRQALAHRFEQALRQLDESFRVYQYVIKRPAPPVTAAPHPHPVVHEALARRTAYFSAKADALFALELYLVILYEGGVHRPSWRGRIRGWAPSPGTAVRERLSAHAVATALSDHLTRAVAPESLGLGDQFGVGAAMMWNGYQRMIDRNWQGSDKWYHCMANCQATNVGPGGAAAAIVGSFFRTNVLSRIREPSDWRNDDKANKCGQHGGDCEKTCAPYLPKSSPGKPVLRGW